MEVTLMDIYIDTVGLISEYPHKIKQPEPIHKPNSTVAFVHPAIHTPISCNDSVQNKDNKKYTLDFRFSKISRRIFDNIKAGRIYRDRPVSTPPAWREASKSPRRGYGRSPSGSMRIYSESELCCFSSDSRPQLFLRMVSSRPTIPTQSPRYRR